MLSKILAFCLKHTLQYLNASCFIDSTNFYTGKHNGYTKRYHEGYNKPLLLFAEKHQSFNQTTIDQKYISLNSQFTVVLDCIIVFCIILQQFSVKFQKCVSRAPFCKQKGARVFQ